MRLRNKKTGEIGEAHWVTFRADGTDLCVSLHENGTYEEVHSLAELNEEWEDYAPKEPLIEDEEIRRVIRCLGFEKIAFTQLGLTWRAYDANLDGGFELVIKTKPFDTCEDGGIYDIAELCGEEEAPVPSEPSFIDLDERIKEKASEKLYKGENDMHLTEEEE